MSVNNNVPISLLIMSRTFFLKEELTSLPNTADSSKSISGLQDVISGMDEEVVNEVLLEVATPEESRKNLDVIKIKMEVLESENEKIEEEAEARREKEKKKKKEKEKEREKKEKEKEKEKVDKSDVEDVVVEEVVFEPEPLTPSFWSTDSVSLSHPPVVAGGSLAPLLSQVLPGMDGLLRGKLHALLTRLPPALWRMLCAFAFWCLRPRRATGN